MKRKEQTLGDWCKWLEKNFSLEKTIPSLPIIIRLDGSNFSKWTKGLEKPFDLDFIKLMEETTKYLVDETNAVVGYTQSDEITLVLFENTRKTEIYYNGKKQKILSKLTAKCCNFFNKQRKEYDSLAVKIDAIFDCRIYQVPSLQDACDQLLWRELDAIRNSILSLGQSRFSHKQLMNVRCDELKEKLLNTYNINWDDLDMKLKRGIYIRSQIDNIKFSKEEIDKLPLKHKARTEPNGYYQRRAVTNLDIPFLSKIENKLEVIFNSESPILK
jgi:tRNA(His) 5'-end guanylyltransferase